jgi:hypothetical protein
MDTDVVCSAFGLRTGFEPRMDTDVVCSAFGLRIGLRTVVVLCSAFGLRFGFLFLGGMFG